MFFSEKVLILNTLPSPATSPFLTLSLAGITNKSKHLLYAIQPVPAACWILPYTFVHL